MIVDGEMEIVPSVSALFAASGIVLAFTVARYAMSDAFDTAQLLDIDLACIQSTAGGR